MKNLSLQYCYYYKCKDLQKGWYHYTVGSNIIYRKLYTIMHLVMYALHNIIFYNL
jgi:hypothetical protein